MIFGNNQNGFANKLSNLINNLVFFKDKNLLEKLTSISSDYKKIETNYLKYINELEKENYQLKLETQQNKNLEGKLRILNSENDELKKKVSLYENIINKSGFSNSDSNNNKKISVNDDNKLIEQTNINNIDKLIDFYFLPKLDSLNRFSEYNLDKEKEEIKMLFTEAKQILSDYKIMEKEFDKPRNELETYRLKKAAKNTVNEVNRRLDRIDLLKQAVELDTQQSFDLKDFLKQDLPKPPEVKKYEKIKQPEIREIIKPIYDDRKKATIDEISSDYVPKHAIKDELYTNLFSGTKKVSISETNQEPRSTYYGTISQYRTNLKVDKNNYNPLSMAALIISGDYINENRKKVWKWSDREKEIKKYYDGRNKYTSYEKEELIELEKIIDSNKYARKYRKDNLEKIKSYLAPKKDSKFVGFFKDMGKYFGGYNKR